MGCFQNRVLFDGSLPDHRNIKVFYAPEGEVTQVCVNGLYTEDEIPILVKEGSEYNDYYGNNPDGNLIILTENNPCAIVEGGKWYKLDTSTVDGNPDVSINANSQSPHNFDSEFAYLLDTEYGNIGYTPVEVIRFSADGKPVIYEMGTGNQIQTQGRKLVIDRDPVHTASKNQVITAGTPYIPKFDSGLAAGNQMKMQNVGQENIKVKLYNATFLLKPGCYIIIETRDEYQNTELSVDTGSSEVAIYQYFGEKR